MIVKNDILKYLHDDSSILDIQSALSNLKLYAISKKDQKVVDWVERELNGYAINDDVPAYRELQSNEWHIETTYDVFYGDITKQCCLSEFVSAQYTMDNDEKKKKIKELIDFLRKKRFFVRIGFNNIESDSNKKLGEIYGKELEYIAAWMPIQPDGFKDLIFPKDIKFICNDSNLFVSKIKKIVKDEIKCQLISINKDIKSLNPKNNKNILMLKINEILSKFSGLNKVQKVIVLLVSGLIGIASFGSNLSTTLEFLLKYI